VKLVPSCLCQNRGGAESIIAKVRTVQSRVPVRFPVENITYVFEWPDSKMSDVEFLNLVCRETGARLLLDVENVYRNATNHRFDPYAFIDALRPGLVKQMHMAGGVTIHDEWLSKPPLADSHSHPVPDAALDLLEYMLARQPPASSSLSARTGLRRATKSSTTSHASAHALALVLRFRPPSRGTPSRAGQHFLV
jgi:uncharacterized protein (UPF0276 family)